MMLRWHRRSTGRDVVEGPLDDVAFFRALCEAFPDGLLIADAEGRIVRVNERLEQMSGYTRDELLGQPVEVLVPEPSRAHHVVERSRFILGPRVRHMGSGLPLWLRRKDGSELPVDIGLSTLTSPGGLFVASAIREDTARRRAEEMLRQSEVIYRQLVERIPAITHVSRLDPTASTVYISPQVEAVLGYAPHEWEADGELWVKLLSPDDRAEALAANARMIETGVPLVLDYRMVARDGRIVWIHEESEVIRDEEGTPACCQGVLVDVTEQRRAEDEIQRTLERLQRTDAERRRLLAHLVGVREEERTRIAADIHDDPLQKIAALRIRVGMLMESLQGREEIEQIEEVDRTIFHTLVSLRKLLFELHPLILDREGLGTALRELLEQVTEDAPLTFAVEDRMAGETTPEIRVTCFRIAQEAIRNVLNHARATRVELTLASERDGTLVTVRDDGAGFIPEQVVPAPGHLGLPDMRDRAELADGWLRITSAPGAGTTVEFWIPGRAA